MNTTHSARLQQLNSGAAGLLGGAIGAFTVMYLSTKKTREQIRDHILKQFDIHTDEKKPEAG